MQSALRTPDTPSAAKLDSHWAWIAKLHWRRAAARLQPVCDRLALEDGGLSLWFALRKLHAREADVQGSDASDRFGPTPALRNTQFRQRYTVWSPPAAIDDCRHQ
jgi:hypothetical protein